MSHLRVHPANRIIPTELLPASTPVVIASSAGGPEALRIFLQALSTDSPVGGVIVQHISAGFSTMLSRNLSHMCNFTIKEVEPGDRIRQGQFLVARGGYHLAFNRNGTARLVDAAPINSVKPAADLTMATLAPIYTTRLIGVVLTGLGRDGLDGSHAVKAHGGSIFAQDQQSSFAYFMPKEVTEAGLAEASGSPDKLAQLVTARSRKRYLQTMVEKPKAQK